MTAWLVRGNFAAVTLCLPVLVGACGSSSNPATPASPSIVLPSSGPCQASTAARLSLAIVNGEACDAATSSVVMLVMRRADGAVSRCSGTVIGSQSILTAAHCVSGNPIEVTVVPGGAAETPAQSFAVHPQYEPGPYPLDIAVVTTSRPIGRRAIPMLVSRNGRVGETGVLVGFGVERIGGSSGELRAAGAAIDFVGETFLTTRFSASDAATCSGDSGGPLLLSESGTWMLAGVAATGVFLNTTNAPPCQNGISVYAGVRAATISSFIRGLVPDASFR